MNPDLLIAHFDRISDAPDAVPRLRQFILDLAVRGRLVEPNPKDEPASELLKGIQVAKLRLVKEGKINKQRPLPPIDTLSVPYGLPDGWSWTRLGHLAQLVTSGSRDWAKYYASEGAIFVRMGNLSRDSYHLRLSNIQRVKVPAGSEGARTKLEAGDILISITGEVGLLGLIPPDFGEAYINQHTCLVRPMRVLESRYLPLLFCSPFAQAQFDEPQRGLKNSFRLTDVADFLVPLPPLAEQHRIVAKVDELMTLCDQLESLRSEQEAQRECVASSALHYLSNGASPDNLKRSSHFYLDHLNDLIVRPSQIPELRRTILSLAVQGKLVSQNQNEDPASALIRQIEAEKSRRIEAGILRNERSLVPISPDKEPFAIPENWTWARIGTCALLTEYGTSVKSDELEDGVPVLAMGDIQDGQVILKVRKKVPRDIEELPNLFLKCFDLLYNRTNSAELVGKTGIYLGQDDAFTFASYLIRIRFIDELISPVYINLAINAPYFRKTQIVPELRQQCGQANVNGTKLRNMMIPLPPLAEQRRIVTKVNQLMVLCDQLEEALGASQMQSSRLRDSILFHALQVEAPETEQMSA